MTLEPVPTLINTMFSPHSHTPSSHFSRNSLENIFTLKGHFFCFCLVTCGWDSGSLPDPCCADYPEMGDHLRKQDDLPRDRQAQVQF